MEEAARQTPPGAPDQAAAAETKGLNLLRAVNSRVAALEAALRTRDEQLASTQAELDVAKVSTKESI
jgi:hypothetical protein